MVYIYVGVKDVTIALNIMSIEKSIVEISLNTDLIMF